MEMGDFYWEIRSSNDIITEAPEIQWDYCSRLLSGVGAFFFFFLY